MIMEEFERVARPDTEISNVFIDAASIALKIAEALVDAKLAHSKRTYPYPLEKEIVGYP